jgi:release factor glutamine methyltransferase
MIIDKWLKNAIKRLDSASIPTAKLDAEVLLADYLGRDRTLIHAHNEHALQKSDLRILNEQIERRIKHEPLAYIRGKQEFYGRDFMVSPDTLTPRSETETMIELLLKQIKKEYGLQTKDNSNSNPRLPIPHLSVVDFGTGSGCIIITVALELAKISNIKYQISFLGIDISEPALQNAKLNANSLNANVDFQKLDLLKDDLNLVIKYHTSNIVLANLPYVPDDFQINLAATHEPEIAIFGGKDGLDYYRVLFSKLETNDSSSITVLTETLPPQHDGLSEIASKSGFSLVKTQDFIQVFEKLST